ncbi:MAG: phosphotransferase, partial [Myxococcales bacterium]|nr:phosphotransferase [Myxococcales bacterium]
MGWDHAESDVWRVSGDLVVYVKRHRTREKLAREHRAYRDWMPLHPGRHPRLLEATDTLLVISEVAGEPVQDASPDVHRQAGRWIRALHDLPFEDADSLPLAHAMARRAAWLDRAAHLVHPTAIARARGTLGLFDGTVRVPCHRDYSPRNWLVDARGTLGVIDLEHTLGDLWLADVVKLASGDWVDRPDREAAFWEGYGRTPDARERQQLDALVILTAIST